MSVDATSLLRLEKTSLREQALTALRKAITSGQLAPGTHLVETELSDALQISRGTLREAMRQLQQEGLISAGARGVLRTFLGEAFSLFNGTMIAVPLSSSGFFLVISVSLVLRLQRKPR